MFRLISWYLFAASMIVVSSFREKRWGHRFKIVNEDENETKCSSNICSNDEVVFDSRFDRSRCCRFSNMTTEPIIGYNNERRWYSVLIIEDSVLKKIPQDLLSTSRPISLRIIKSGLTILKISDFKDSTQLQQVNFTANSIDNLEPNMFIHAPNIEVIDLSDNLISKVSEYAFENVPGLRILILTNNFIKAITFKSNLINLEIFMIGNNSLSELNENLLQGSVNLKNLCINDNNLNISKLNIAKDLEVFDMSSNPRSIYLPSKIMKIRNSNVRLLNIYKTSINIDASNNQIDSIVVDPENNLLELNLSKNNFTSIQNLTILKHIQKLDLSFNKIQDFTLTSFSNMTELQVLNLENSGLKHIDYGTFSQQKDLVWLDISYNNLKEINFNMLTDIIENLYIEGNELTNIDMTAIHITLPKLQIWSATPTRSGTPANTLLGLSNNNFSCEKLVEIRRALSGSSIQMYVDESLMVKFSRNINGIGCMNENSTEKIELKSNKLLPIHKDGLAHDTIIETIQGKIKEIEKNIRQHNDSLTENSINSRDDVLSMKQDIMNVRNDIDLKVIDAKADILMSVSNLFNVSINGSVANVDLKTAIEELNRINLERYQSLSSQLKLVRDKLQALERPENFNQKNVLQLKQNSDTIDSDSNYNTKGSSGDLIPLKDMMTFIVVAIIMLIFGFILTVSYKRYTRRHHCASTNTVNTNVEHEQSLV